MRKAITPVLFYSNDDVEEAMRAVVAGDYNSTIEVGSLGDDEFHKEELVVIASSDFGFAVGALFEEVSWCELGDVPESNRWLVGEKNYLRFVHKLSWKTRVAVVRWKDLSGKLVDEYKEKVQLQKKILGGVCNDQRENFLHLTETGKHCEEFDKHLMSGCVGCAQAVREYFESSPETLRQHLAKTIERRS